MRVVVQRVTCAKCDIDGQTVGSIANGFLLLVGFTHSDTEKDVRYVAKKVAQMRVFSDNEGKMNLSLADTGGAVLSISQFTLYADTRHGNRPSFISAAKPQTAEPLYNLFNRILREDYSLRVETGRFGADMQISLVNNGPVTVIIDSNESNTVH
ncbi:MAG: D-tyrosyl-tRNA(Tyr) deacylase [Paludibacteraceae bacterium]|nr:D-tyrosyl-tRNA(Tyr) deacylase [Paludibacteraceae bacterium]